MSNPAIEEAYEKAGGRRKVKESLGVSKQSLSDWTRKGYVPAEKAGKLETLSGVSRRKLCPDFDWGPTKHS
jgi:DNA-binding transcriptional regulator YdaS (Cro superfamily)